MWNSQAENAGSILVASSKVLRRKYNIFGHGVLNRSAPKATDLTNEVELTASSAVVADYPALPNHGRRDRLISRAKWVRKPSAGQSLQETQPIQFTEVR
jgi:hypothetical protein